MKLKISLLAGIAAFGFATSANAQTVINITGATAFRAAMNNTILSVLSDGGATTVTYCYVASSTSQGAFEGSNRIIAQGTIGGQPYIIRTNQNGSTQGIASVATQTTPPNFSYLSVTGTATDRIAGGQHLTAATVDAPASGKVDAGVIGRFAFSDVSQDISNNPSPVLPGTGVGVVPFVFVANVGAPVGLTNMTDQLHEAQWSLGQLKLSMYTGNPADTKLVLNTGRNNGSGTRATILAETQYGPFRNVVQWGGPNSTANVGGGEGTGTVTGSRTWATTAIHRTASSASFSPAPAPTSRRNGCLRQRRHGRPGRRHRQLPHPLRRGRRDHDHRRRGSRSEGPDLQRRSLQRSQRQERRVQPLGLPELLRLRRHHQRGAVLLRRLRRRDPAQPESAQHRHPHQRNERHPERWRRRHHHSELIPATGPTDSFLHREPDTSLHEIRMNSKIRTTFLAAAGLVLGATAATAAPWPPAKGDLILGVRASGGTGSTTNVFFNLGPAHTLRDTPNPGTLLANLNTELTSAFGEDWATRNDLYFGIIANRNNAPASGLGSAPAQNGDPSRTIYASKGTGSANSTTPWAFNTSALGVSATAIGGFMEAIDNIAANGNAVMTLTQGANPVEWNNGWSEWNPVPGPDSRSSPAASSGPSVPPPAFPK